MESGVIYNNLQKCILPIYKCTKVNYNKTIEKTKTGFTKYIITQKSVNVNARLRKAETIMKKAIAIRKCAEIFEHYMGIKVTSKSITLMELTADENHIDYVYFTVGNRHYVYNERFYKSFVMFPDETLTDGIQLEEEIRKITARA